MAWEEVEMYSFGERSLNQIKASDKTGEDEAAIIAKETDVIIERP